jgi:hypothetical protein
VEMPPEGVVEEPPVPLHLRISGADEQCVRWHVNGANGLR